MAKEQGIKDKDLIIYQGECHNHLHNIWIDHIKIFLGEQLQEYIQNDLELIPSNLRVACRLSE